MHINFINHKKEEVSFYNDNLIHLIAPNSCGKTRMLDLIFDGFNGKLKDKFLIDGNVVGKDEYDVIKINDIANIEIEESWNTKSVLKKEVDLIEKDSFEDIITNKIKELQSLIEDMINQNINFNVNAVVDIDLDKILSKNIKIKYNEMDVGTLSFSEKRLLLIELYLNILKISTKKKVLIIDEFTLGLSKPNIINLLEILQCSDAYIFISSSYGRINNESCLYFNEHGYTDELIDKYRYFMIKNEIENIDDLRDLYSKEEVEEYQIVPADYSLTEEAFIGQKVDTEFIIQILSFNLL